MEPATPEPGLPELDVPEPDVPGPGVPGGVSPGPAGRGAVSAELKQPYVAPLSEPSGAIVGWAPLGSLRQARR